MAADPDPRTAFDTRADRRDLLEAAAAGQHVPDWQLVARTRDGTPYRIRPIRVDDARRDRTFVVNLSEKSRYLRMMGTVREPSDSLIEQFVHVDYRHSMAIVAVGGEGDGEYLIAVARYAADPNSTQGEFAIAVADAWQSRGVGATLLEVLFDYARIQGLRSLHGSVLASNAPMLRLARKHLLRLSPVPGDHSVIEVTRDL